MKKALRFCALSLLCLSPVLLPALPKVAVLDLTLQKGIDSTVIIPVTESVMEEVVGARAYVVLDRAYIEQILKEKEFQMSGLVSDTQVAQAGQYLGADYVVAGKIQLVGETYFIVAKMIEVKTGVIVAQSSEQGEGKVSVLLSMAHAVGKKLVGGSPISALTPATATPAPTSTPIASQGARQGLPVAGKPVQGGQAPFADIDAKDPVPQGQVTLNILSQYDPNSDAGKTWREIMDAFRAKYPNIKIEEQNFKDAQPYWDRFGSIVNGDMAPDIFMQNMGSRFDVGSPAGELGPLLNGREEAYLPSVRNVLQTRIGIRFLPEMIYSTHVMYANRRLLDKLGLPVPENLDVLIAQQPAIKKAGLVPVAMSDRDGWPAQSCLLSTLASRSGGQGWVWRAMRKDQARFSDPEFVDAIQAIKRMIDAKLFPPNVADLDYDAPLEMFNSEKAVYLIDGGWRLGQIRQDLPLEIMSLPEVPGMRRTGAGGATTVQMTGYGLNANLSGDKLRAAWLWLWFYAGPEGARIRFQRGGTLVSPIDPRMFLGEIDGRLERYYDFLAGAELDDIIDVRLNGRTINDIMKQVMAGKKKPAAAAEEIEKWAEKNLPDRRR